MTYALSEPHQPKETTMTIDSKALKVAALSHSKAIVGLGLAAMVISIYLLQRSATILDGLVNPNNLQQTQTVQSGLNFSYYILSITWPIIIGVICIVFSTVVRRRNEIVALLSANGFSTEFINLEDPLYLQFDRDFISQTVVTAAAFLPTIAIVASTYAVLRESGISLAGGAQLVTGLIGIALTRSFVVEFPFHLLKAPIAVIPSSK